MRTLENREKLKKIIDTILDFAEEHPILVPIINAIIVSFITTMIIILIRI